MSIILNLTWGIVLLPLVGVGAAFVADSPRRSAQAGIGFTALALAASLVVLLFRLTHAIPVYENVQTFWDVSGASTTTVKGPVFPTDFLLTWGIRVDPLSVTFMVVVLFVSLVAQLHAFTSVRGEDGYRRLFWLSGALTFGLLASIASPNLFQFLLGWEVTAVAAWLLGLHGWRRTEAAAPSVRSFIVLRIADAALLLALAFTYAKFAVRASQQATPAGLPTSDALSFSGLTPLWHLAHIGAVGLVGTRSLVLLSILFVVAAMVRAGLGPMHLWLTGSTAAPAPALALVAVAAPLSAAVLLARVYPLLTESPGMLSVLAVLGAAAAVVGATLALAQRDLFRIGLFAMCSQAGLVLATLGMGGFSPALFMLFTGSLLTLLFFLSAANLARVYRSRDLTQLGGAWRRMPRSSLGLAVWAAGISGLSLNTYSVLSATLRNSVPLGGASARVVQVLVALLVFVAIALTAAFAFRTVLLVTGGDPARRRGFDVTRVREAERPLVGLVLVTAAAAIVATLVGLPGVSSFSLGGHRIAGLTFSHFVFFGAVRQQLALDVAALAAALLTGIGGAAAAWYVYAPQRRAAGEHVRARLATVAHVLGGVTPAERGAQLLPGGFVVAGTALGVIDAQLIAPLLDAPGETARAAGDGLHRLPMGHLSASLTAAVAVLVVIVAAAVLAVTGNFPVVTR